MIFPTNTTPKNTIKCLLARVRELEINVLMIVEISVTRKDEEMRTANMKFLFSKFIFQRIECNDLLMTDRPHIPQSISTHHSRIKYLINL